MIGAGTQTSNVYAHECWLSEDVSLAASAFLPFLNLLRSHKHSLTSLFSTAPFLTLYDTYTTTPEPLPLRIRRVE